MPRSDTEFLSIPEAVVYLTETLGARIGRATLYGLVAEGRVEHKRVGRRIYFTRSQLADLVNDGLTVPAS